MLSAMRFSDLGVSHVITTEADETAILAILIE
eukprot:SAG11_NODE_1344_length_5148_cov_5.463260_5_plen_32_part_00